MSSFLFGMQELIHWLESHLLSCPYKSWLGLNCPGCGMQRSFIALLKGNFVESIVYYPALLPIMITFMLTAIHLIFKLKNGDNYIKYSFIISISIVTINFIVRLILGID